VLRVKKCHDGVIPCAVLQKFIKDFPKAGSVLLTGLSSTQGRRVRDLTRKIMEQSKLSKIRVQPFMSPDFSVHEIFERAY
jgi:hypothetical protein